MIDALSLGVGVQSSTLAFMADRGLVQPMPALGIFGDTQDEPRKVYEWYAYLKAHIKNFPIVDGTKGKLSEDSLRVRRSKKSGKLYLAVAIPLFVKNPDGSKGIIGRKCTRDYKIQVVAREIKKFLGLRRVSRLDGRIIARVWIGISTDEADRQKPSQIPYIQSRWPFLEDGTLMSRLDCLRWMRDNGYPEPPRSACKQCPYRSDAGWIAMRRDEPLDFQDAVAWERRIQAAASQQEVLKGIPYIHSSLVPLDQVKFDPDKGKHSFSNECEGMCGV